MTVHMLRKLNKGTDIETKKCEFCDFESNQDDDMNAHTASTHKKAESGPKMGDEESAKVDIEVPSKNSGTKSVTASESVYCPFCKLQSKHLDALRTHLENIHGSKEPNKSSQDAIISQGSEQCLKCLKCSFIGSKNEMNDHMRRRHGRTMACEQCGNDFPDENTLKGHIESVHRSNEPFPCEFCGLVIANFNLLKEHVERCHAPRSEYCYFCDFV